MKKEMELYVHSAKDAEPTLVSISPDATVNELAKAIQGLGVFEGPIEEFSIFAEDGDEPLKGTASLESAGLKHRGHVHCHRCRRVAVSVMYNGVEKADAFPPSAKVKRVLKWAIGAFQLKGVDAENKVLRLADPPQTELVSDAHIGSFVQGSKCELRLCLVPPIRFQG